MSKKAKKDTKQNSTVNRIFILEIIVLLILMLFAIKVIGYETRKTSLEHMATITDERAHIIDNFVENSEDTLANFCRASQVSDLLELDPSVLKALVDKDDPNYGTASAESKKILEKAQLFTETFGRDIDNLEGVWIGTWDTLVMTQTNRNVVGMTTRKDPTALEQLRNSLIAAGDGVYNTGIIISPASGKQIVSMYKGVFDSHGNPIGLVGLGIYTDGLIETLDQLSIRGIDDSTYCMVNVTNNKYIFHADKDLVQKETEIPAILELCKKASKGDKIESDSFGYTAKVVVDPVSGKEKNRKFISSYTYMSKYNWLLMLDAPKSEVYLLTYSLRIFFVIFSVLMLGILVIFFIISKRQESVNRKLSSQIVKTEKTKQSLTTAMFRDILTDASNRISFSMDVSKLGAEENKCYYFVFVNISGFSEINTNFGNDAGDQVLLSTVESLRKVFPNGTIYRTGSDEFIVTMQSDNTTAGYNAIINSVNTAHAILLTPHETPSGKITAEYKIAVAKKSENINTSVISTLKELTNRSGDAVFGQVQYVDLDESI